MPPILQTLKIVKKTNNPGYKMATKNILLLPGDGIGPEVMHEVVRVLEWFQKSKKIQINISEDLIGGVSFDKHGVPLAPAVLEKARAVDAILLGAVGGPQWSKVAYDKRPEAGLLLIRKELGLFANLRPAIVFDALIDASSLKADVIRGLDILIVRELTGGVYFGEPRGIRNLPNGEREGINTQIYKTSEIIRVARVAFELARKRRGKVCSSEKSNVMESGLLWREEVTKLHGSEYQDVELSHMYADNCAMQLLRDPKQFDVILTDNLFGDILSDEAAMLTGSLGMLPSASLGAETKDGHRSSMYEPIHGSAPDIAGQNSANPLASILSAALMLRYSFGLLREANLIDQAVKSVLNKGIRTADIKGSSQKTVGTDQMGKAVCEALAAIA